MSHHTPQQQQAEEDQPLVQGKGSLQDTYPSYSGCTVLLLYSAFIIALSSFQFGFGIGVMNSPELAIRICPANTTVVPLDNSTSTDGGSFKPCVPMSPVQWSLVISVFPIGGLIGGLLGGKLADLLGRKWFLWSTNFLFLIGTACLSLFSNFWAFLVARILVGFASGIASAVAPMYLGEISPDRFKGTIGSMHQLFITIGILYAQLLGIPLAVQEHQLWRILFTTSVPFILIQLLGLPLVPQSPVWLLNRNNDKGAEEALQRLRSTDNVSYELTALRRANQKTGNVQVGLGALFRRQHLLQLFVAVGLMFFQQFSGINVVMNYSSGIFTAAKVQNPNLATAIMGIVNVVATIVSVILIDYLGRRVLLIASELGMIVFFVSLATSFILQHFDIAASTMSWVSVVSVIGYIINFAYGMGPVPWLLMSELFPSDVVGYAVSLSVATNWICNTITAFSFPPLDGVMKPYTFIPYAVLIVVSLVFTLLFVPRDKKAGEEEKNTQK